MKLSLGLALAALLLAGCSSSPSRLKPPSISPSGAASQAMTDFDKDGDGFIAGSELDAAPAIKAAMATIDTDKDGKASESELSDRIASWSKGAGLTTCFMKITLNGRPLPGATVTFDPAPFLADVLKPAVGTTNADGQVSVSIPKEDRVPADSPPGLYYGLYRVRVSKQEGGKETIPPKYNSETVLGQQVARDDPAIMGQRVAFDLKP